MTIVRVGTTKKYSDGWEAAFGKGKKRSTPAKSAGKATAPKSAGKKKSTKKRPAKAKKKGKK